MMKIALALSLITTAMFLIQNQWVAVKIILVNPFN